MLCIGGNWTLVPDRPELAADTMHSATSPAPVYVIARHCPSTAFSLSRRHRYPTMPAAKLGLLCRCLFPHMRNGTNADGRCWNTLIGSAAFEPNGETCHVHGARKFVRQPNSAQ